MDILVLGETARCYYSNQLGNSGKEQICANGIPYPKDESNCLLEKFYDEIEVADKLYVLTN